MEVVLLSERPRAAGVVVAGCDPAFRLVMEAMRRRGAAEVFWWQRSSLGALEALARGEAHVAGFAVQMLLIGWVPTPG